MPELIPSVFEEEAIEAAGSSEVRRTAEIEAGRAGPISASKSIARARLLRGATRHCFASAARPVEASGNS